MGMRWMVGFGVGFSVVALLVVGGAACSSNASNSAVPGAGAGGGNSAPGTFAPGNGSPSGAAGSIAAPNTVANAGSTGSNTGNTGLSNLGTGGTSSSPVTAATGLPMPCNVATVVSANCQQCHGKTPIGGAPMSLLTYDDFQRPAKTMPTLKVFQLAKMRINDKAKPMPQGGTWKTPTDFATLDAWLGAGAVAGSAADMTCAGAVPPPDTTGMGSADGSYGPVTAAPGETCYELQTHSSTTSVDSTPYSVSTGEHYEQFYFNVPWKKGDQGTRFGTRFDNEKVLHHWLLFTTAMQVQAGYHEKVSGTQLGDVATLLAGWAVGGSNVATPDDVGMELPDPGTMLNLQWHFFNSTSSPQDDRSAVQVCTVPAGTRPHTSTITWLGTEDLGTFTGGMPAHQMSQFSGTCDPLREGMNSTDPIHILAFWPHMHQLGVQMQTFVNHKGGTMEKVFDMPFDFNHQVHFPQKIDLAAGDTITATCIYNNTTDASVGFGSSSKQEMCYQFAYSWPAHALENHIISLIGATNTCW
jgi:hypothetical protein